MWLFPDLTWRESINYIYRFHKSCDGRKIKDILWEAANLWHVSKSASPHIGLCFSFLFRQTQAAIN